MRRRKVLVKRLVCIEDLRQTDLYGAAAPSTAHPTRYGSHHHLRRRAAYFSTARRQEALSIATQ